mmetsp:Transcript_147541/g.471860  ORF Transcript_147541/g.471860 Transcript_147541/m.471860 type:complete len:109 (-) Transcript_147541:635-961(-)
MGGMGGMGAMQPMGGGMPGMGGGSSAGSSWPCAILERSSGRVAAFEERRRHDCLAELHSLNLDGSSSEMCSGAADCGAFGRVGIPGFGLQRPGWQPSQQLVPLHMWSC